MTHDAQQPEHWFINTHTSRLIRDGVAHSIDRKSTVLIVGPPGIGKTATLLHIVEQEPTRARMIVVTPATKGVKAFLISVANAFNIMTVREQTHDIQQILCDRLWGLDHAYLIIDEAQNLDLDAFRTALYLHEETKLPITFVGNPTTLRRVNSKAAAFEQISDRLYHRVELAGVIREDAIAFGVHHNVEGADAYDFLVRFGLKTSLRQLDGLLWEARSRAGARGSIAIGHLVDALGDLRGPEIARDFLTQTKEGRNGQAQRLIG